MGLQISDVLITDDLTILLGLIGATLFLLNNLYRPQPLVHPILLGRQSDVGRARNPKESAIYRNYATGMMGRFPLRPGKEVYILHDLVKQELEGPRTLWSTKLTNGHLLDRGAAFGTGLLRLTRLQPQKSTVLLLLNDCLEFIVSDLALASHSIHSLTLSSATLLSPILDAHQPSAIITHAFLLPQLLELIYDASADGRRPDYTIIVVGTPSAGAMASVASNVRVLNFDDVEAEGAKREKILSTLPKQSDVFSTSFYRTPEGEIAGAQISHDVLVAGVAAIRALFPVSAVLSPLDTVVSSHSMSTAYGRAVAYTAVYEGSAFATVPSADIYSVDGEDIRPDSAATVATRKYPVPPPTVLFLRPGHFVSTVSGILSTARASKSLPFGLLFSFAWRHKLAALREGFVGNQSLWDRLLLDGARTKTLGWAAGVREIIVSGGPIPEDALTPARVALSVPLVNAFTHPLCTAPVLATHPLDLQDFTRAGPSAAFYEKAGETEGYARSAPFGPPSVNVETKLVGVDDEAVENAMDPEGTLLVRGPPVARRVSLAAFVKSAAAASASPFAAGGVLSASVSGEDYVNVDFEGAEVAVPVREEETEGWISCDVRARVMTNGSFVLV